MTRAALITIAHGRHDHWSAQQQALARSERPPAERVLVTMDDAELASIARGGRHPPTVVELGGHDAGLPLAAARNAGAAAAIRLGAEVLVFLDVDCLPAPGLVGAYASAAQDHPGRLLSGPVTYLDPPPPAGYDLARLADLDAPHPVRPAPEPGEVQVGGDPDLFWSLSFAVDTSTWTAIDGFHEGYVGYGAEDTDFAHVAAQRGIGMAWVGSARAYHQYHPVQDPPVGHLDAILRNAALFHERWGVWPMGGWLDAFERLDLIEPAPDGAGFRRLATKL